MKVVRGIVLIVLLNFILLLTSCLALPDKKHTGSTHTVEKFAVVRSNFLYETHHCPNVLVFRTNDGINHIYSTGGNLKLNLGLSLLQKGDSVIVYSSKSFGRTYPDSIKAVFVN